MNIAERYFEELKKGRVIVHAMELAVLRGGMAYRFDDGSILHMGPQVGLDGKPARAYDDLAALLANEALPADPEPLPWEPYGRYCSMYLDSLVEGLSEQERRAMAMAASMLYAPTIAGVRLK